MSTRTRPQQRSTASSRRFAKPGATPQGRRTGTTGRRTTTTAGRPRTLNVRRRKPPKSNTDKALGALTGLMGGKKAASSGSKGAKAGAGVAMLTAAAGLAFKNRDKLTAMLKRDGGAPDTDVSRPPAGTTGAHVHPVTNANATNLSGTESTGTGSGLGHADTPSSLDPPDTALGGTASGTTDPRVEPSPLDSPYVSPRDPGTEEPPLARG